MTSTPITTPAGGDPFGGAPGDPNPAATDAPVSSGMPTFTQGGSTGKSKTFGGVPVGQFPQGPITTPSYQVPGTAPGEMVPGTSQPQYTDGDQWAPASDPNPDTARTLQVQLINAGLLTLKQVHLGIWDSSSATAYAKVLAHANLAGVPAQTALDEYVKSSAELPQKTINPDDLNALANQVAQTTLGRNLRDDELAKFSTAFQTAIAAAPDGGPQTAAGMASLGQGILTKESPKEAAATSLHNVSHRALQVLTNPAVSLPGVQ